MNATRACTDWGTMTDGGIRSRRYGRAAPQPMT
jgi:hypothetical protein